MADGNHKMIDRRQFLRDSGLLALTSGYSSRKLNALASAVTESTAPEPNPNLADAALGAKASASSYVDDPPWGYGPENVFGEVPFRGWQADKQLAGAWIEISFPERKTVSELWVLAQPLPPHVLGQDVYLMTHSRVANLTSPKKVRVEFSSGPAYSFTLRQAAYLQILSLPEARETASIRLVVEDVWPGAGATDVGFGKIRIFGHRHDAGFDIIPQAMYSALDGNPVQAATLRIVNPNEAMSGGALLISGHGEAIANVPLKSTPARSVFEHEIQIPAPFEDSEFDFGITAPSLSCSSRKLLVPRYSSYFDGGTFEFECTNHNDLGWLDTQAKTADYRSSALILPALELMQKYPEFEYTMECTAYLMEFLDRHPEKKEEMASLMRAGRFVWAASYVQLLQVSAGPEKLVRQFYFGRRWLKCNFPGVDSTLYMQTDPPSMSLQMPQVLARAGVKYCLLGRLPFGYYNWESPDGSNVLTYGYRYVDPLTLIDFKSNSGWLSAAAERENYYAARHLPPKFMYDYTSDYLPPQEDLVPYIRQQNRDMEEFTSAWNAHFSGQPVRQVHPPKLSITTPDKFLAKLTEQRVEIPTLRGEWPLNWAYYDEPSNREALLDGRIAHNQLVAAESLLALLGMKGGFEGYPSAGLENAWRANVWPDHGWGGNHGLATDQAYTDSYAKSRAMADRLMADAGHLLSSGIAVEPGTQIPVVVYNQLSWPRTDLVEFGFQPPSDWPAWALVDDAGMAVPYEARNSAHQDGTHQLAFVARDIPSLGYRTYYLRRETEHRSNTERVDAPVIETKRFRVVMGKGGIKSLFDKQAQWEVLRTDKFEGGEILQFSAPGNAWDGPEQVTTEHFDRTANHELRLVSMSKTAIRTTAVYEANFADFKLREHLHVYDELERVDIDLEILDWRGTIARELRAVFPINLDEFRASYETPFGTVEKGKDELDFSLLPSALDSQFVSSTYGGDRPLAFREAINWIDASSPNFGGNGCLLGSDVTVHVFHDEADHPVSYPMLQHVLLSVRKSQAWNPEYWYTQAGTHRYRMTILPHRGDWRRRYREAIGFNHRLSAFVSSQSKSGAAGALPVSQNALVLEPHNLIMTALKKAEDDDSIILRFYEAEGNRSVARLRLACPIRAAHRTNLIEEIESEIPVASDGSIELAVGPWEIVTLRLKAWNGSIQANIRDARTELNNDKGHAGVVFVTRDS